MGLGRLHKQNHAAPWELGVRPAWAVSVLQEQCELLHEVGMAGVELEEPGHEPPTRRPARQLLGGRCPELLPVACDRATSQELGHVLVEDLPGPRSPDLVGQRAEVHHEALLLATGQHGLVARRQQCLRGLSKRDPLPGPQRQLLLAIQPPPRAPHRVLGRRFPKPVRVFLELGEVVLDEDHDPSPRELGEGVVGVRPAGAGRVCQPLVHLLQQFGVIPVDLRKLGDASDHGPVPQKPGGRQLLRR
mmetsp:Transcript_51829/g.147737  ORF Transcript_51829/g.147737 Transcript_51829/m.147737 type:complete len:246 (+) Transcript_51829:553-1290(+)